MSRALASTAPDNAMVQGPGMSSNSSGRDESGSSRPRAIDVHAHVIVPEVYAVAAEHNIFSELPADPGVTDEMRGKIKDRSGVVLARMCCLIRSVSA